MNILKRLKGRFMGPRDQSEIDYTQQLDADVTDTSPEPEDAFLEGAYDERNGDE